MFFFCSIDSIYKMFVYKVLWIFTVKCLQLFNKELYVYFVQVPFCESFRNQTRNRLLHQGHNLQPRLLLGSVIPEGQAGPAASGQSPLPPRRNTVKSLLRTSLLLPSGGVYMWWIRTQNWRLSFSWENYAPQVFRGVFLASIGPWGTSIMTSGTDFQMYIK